MDIHLADKLTESIKSKLETASAGKTSMLTSSIFKKLGFTSKRNTGLLEYFSESLYGNQIAVDHPEKLLSVSKSGANSITFYNRVDNVFAGEIEISPKYSTGFGPEEHQIKAMKKMDRFSGADDFAAILVLPTGGGKTFTASYWLAKNVLDKGGKVLWLAHRHSLIDQAMEAFKKVSNRSVFSNVDKIKFRLISGLHDKSVKIQDSDQLVIAGVQSVNYALPTIEKWLAKNDVTLVIDEAHHSIAPTYLKLINSIKKQRNNKVKLLGLTATPTRINDEEEAKLWTLYKDRKVYEIGLDELINKGFLAKPNFIPVKTNVDFISEFELSEDQIKAIIEKDDIAKGLGTNIVKKIAENSQRNEFIVNHYVKNKHKYGKTLVFAMDVLNAIALNKLMKAKGVKSDFVISSATDFQGNNNSSKANQEIIEKFSKGDLDVLVNVQIMTEGTDIPSIQSIFLTRPTNSKTLMTQMIGRGLRGEKAGGTKEAHIVSFVDEWQDKIYWGNAEEILISANLDLDTKSNAYRKMVKQLVSINLLEQFILSQSQEFEDFFDHTEFGYFLPLGFYHFDVEYPGENEESTAKNVSILVYDSMESSYLALMDNLEGIARKAEKMSDQNLLEYLLETYFQNIPQIPTVKKDNIRDLINYYITNKKKPAYVTFEDRDAYNLDHLAEPLADIDSEKARKIAIEELYDNHPKLQDFYKEYAIFKKLIDKVLLKLKDPETYSYTPDVNIDFEKIEIGDKSMGEIKTLNFQYYTFLKEKTFAKALKDFDGEKYYCCQNKKCKTKSRSKHRFQIDHITPREKKGKTILENLQVLCVSCNRKKGAA